MVSLKEVFTNFFNNHNIDLNGKNVVIADSTGVDSSVLLDLTMKYSDANIIVCHVNHGKRSESKLEEEYIESFCKDNNLKYYCYHINPSEIKGNFQEEARKIRYDFFKSIMVKENAPYLLVAHHLNDDIETMLMRMERGSSLKGFSGIDDIVKIKEGYILRPLLTILKKDIYEYALDNDVKYFEDCSNATDHYSRNVIRHHDIPEIFKSIESASNDFIEMKKNISSAACIINEYRDKLIQNTFVKLDNGYAFKIDEFNKLNEFIRIEIIFEVCKKYSLSKKAVLEILNIFLSDKANIESDISNITVIKSYNNGYLLFDYDKEFNINYELKELELGTFDIGNGKKIRISKIDKDKDASLLKDLRVLCYNTIYLPITIRSVKDNDSLAFSYGHKNVNRIFIDKKVDLVKRREAIVVSKMDKVLMVVGLEKSKESIGECADISNCDIKIEFL